MYKGTYETIEVSCSCGNKFETRSTLGEDLHVEVCSKCHEVYTGTQREASNEGRTQKHNTKYNLTEGK